MANSFAKRRCARRVVASAALAVVALAVAGERCCAEPNKQIIERAQHYKDDVLKMRNGRAAAVPGGNTVSVWAMRRSGRVG